MPGRTRVMRLGSMVLGGMLLVLALMVDSPWAQSADLPGAKELQLEADARGLKINLKQMLTLAREEATVVAAPLAGLEEIPATQYRDGVTTGLGYYSSPSQGIAPGFYTVHAIASSTRLGDNPGKVLLLDRDGNVAATLPATMEVTSLTVPSPLPFPETVIAPTLQVEDKALRLWECHCCPNGMCVCFPL